jgi:hypothetical protein
MATQVLSQAVPQQEGRAAQMLSTQLLHVAFSFVPVVHASCAQAGNSGAQQVGSAAQISATHASQLGFSAIPGSHLPCEQSPPVRGSSQKWLN